MGIFKAIGKAIGKVFGQKPVSVFKPLNRKEAEAKTYTEGQTARRDRVLRNRVALGLSTVVYKNKKPVDSAGASLESPYRDAFLDGALFSRFSSSNVWAMQYDRTKETLYIQYLGGKGKKRGGPGRWYSYQNVTIDEAKVFYDAASKGVWTWDVLRQRGTRTGSRKPYLRDTPPPAYLPLEKNILSSP